MWRFFINNSEIEEPEGWDGIEFKVSRSKKYFALENIFSTSLTFVETGADIIKAAYESDGIDADLAFRILQYCDSIDIEEFGSSEVPPVLGEEEIINGDFSSMTGGFVDDWLYSNNSQIPDTKLTDGRLLVDSTVKPDNTFDNGVDFILTITVSGLIGSLSVAQLNFSVIQEITENGTYEIPVNLTLGNFLIFPSGGGGYIDDVSLKEIIKDSSLEYFVKIPSYKSDQVENEFTIVDSSDNDGDYTVTKRETLSGFTYLYVDSINIGTGNGIVLLEGESSDYIIDGRTYKETNGRVEATIEQSSFERKFKNRSGVKLNLGESTALDGESITNIEPFDLRLHSKVILKETKLELNPALTTIDESGSSSSGSNLIYPPSQVIRDEFDESGFDVLDLIVFNSEITAAMPLEYQFIAPSAGTFTINYKIKGSIRAEIGVTTTFDFELAYKKDNPLIWDGGTIGTDIFTIENVGSKEGTNVVQPFDLDGSFTVSASSGDRVSIFFHVIGSSLPDVTEFTGTFEEADLSFQQLTTSDPSTCKAFNIHEAFASLAEQITGEADCFRSDYFGKTDSIHPYETPGCGAYKAVTNGYNLRKMLQQDGSIFDVSMSFDDLYEDMDCIHNLGLLIQEIDGKKYIRVEPKEYFLFIGAESEITLSNVADVTREPARELIFNQFDVGYQEYEVENVNGIDEFNSERTYYVPVQKSDKTLKKVCKAIAGSYPIEYTRRFQYSDDPTTDTRYDNDNFVICTNPTEVTTNKYTGSSQTFSPGTVSERNENFDSVDNFRSPETAYNLRISPVRNAYRWLNWLLMSIYYNDKNIQFKSGSENVQMNSIITDGCETQNVTENEDLDRDADVALFKPNYISFEFPLTLAQFNSISNNGYISFTDCTGETIRGYIEDMSYSPNNNGIASFKLIEGLCNQGGFDDGFDFGFKIGTC